MSRPTPRSWQAALTARFDNAVLRPPPALLPWPPAATETFTALRDWCLAGAVPQRTEPFRIASLSGSDAAVRELALQLCWERDGSLQLQSLGRIGRIGLRLRTKARDLVGGRLGVLPQAADPWDAGWLNADAQGLQALALFVPRRPTLIVVDAAHLGALRTVRTVLARHGAVGSCPVRLLVVGSGSTPGSTPGLDPGPAWRHFCVP